MKRKTELSDLRKFLAKDNARFTKEMVQIPVEQWPKDDIPEGLVEVWRSCNILCQVYYLGEDAFRVSMNRSALDQFGNWEDTLSWDEIQEVKRQIGRGDHLAVEVYPRQKDIVNVAHMRHIWIIPGLELGWSSEKP